MSHAFSAKANRPVVPASPLRAQLRRTRCASLVLSTWAFACMPGLAQPLLNDRLHGLYMEAGPAANGDDKPTSASLGYLMPWAPLTVLRDGPTSLYVDWFASAWRVPTTQIVDRRHYLQLGAIATVRHRFSGGQSPWFVEAGLGVTTMNDRYTTETRRFSTRFQFTEVLAAGFSFSAKGAHELSLRFQHFSNASIRRPNPGVNFVRLRYAYRF